MLCYVTIHDYVVKLDLLSLPKNMFNCFSMSCCVQSKQNCMFANRLK